MEDPAALPAPAENKSEREEKAAQTLEEILAIAKAEEALAAAGIQPAKMPEEADEGGNEASELKPAEGDALAAVAMPEQKPAEQKPAEKKLPEEPKEETEKAIIIPSNRRSSRKKKKQLASVLQMLREYEEEDARNVPKIEAQLMLNLDDATDSLVESPKK